MFRKAHKLAFIVGVAIVLGQCSIAKVPGPWKDRQNSLQQNEAQAAFFKASNIDPRHLGKKPKPKKADWWIF